MKTNTPSLPNLRIVWAITRKDLVDAVKNKNILTILLSALFVVAVYKYLPKLTAESGPPALLVYDPGNSQFRADLESNPSVDVYTYDSREDMQYYLTNGEVPELGLVIPPDIEARAASKEPLQLEGFALEMFKDEEIFDLERSMESEFERILGHPVDIHVERLALQAETYGVTVMVGMGFVFVTLMVGVIFLVVLFIGTRVGRQEPVVGLYERGLQVNDIFFVPYEEIASHEVKSWGLGPISEPYLRLKMRYRPTGLAWLTTPRLFMIPMDVLGDDGLEELERRLGAREREVEPPKLVLYGHRRGR